MAKELNRDELIKSFQEDAEKAQEKVTKYADSEADIKARLDDMQAKFDDRTAKTRARLADVQAKKAEAQAKVDGLAQKVEWAQSFPGADNAPVVTADVEFGDATAPTEQDADEAEPVAV